MPNLSSFVIFFFLSLAVTALTASSPRKTIVGVSPENRNFYLPAKDFRCQKNGVRIPFSRVNDNYCDCSDASDEPGTSACSPLGRFYCQNKGHVGEHIPSIFVNDGVCDCCDGEEETMIYCPNTCRQKWEILKQVKQKEIELHLQGFELKENIMKSATSALKEKKDELSLLKHQADNPLDYEDNIEPPESPHKKMNEIHNILKIDYGKNNEFFHLYGATFEFKHKEYVYKFLPFNVAQQDNCRLGTWKGWNGDYTKMAFTGGEQCWDGPTREMMVSFICGQSEKILQVEEPSKCAYTMLFSTPAACSWEYANYLTDFIKQREVL